MKPEYDFRKGEPAAQNGLPLGEMAKCILKQEFHIIESVK